MADYIDPTDGSRERDNIDVLCVNHHGANNSSAAEFLCRVAPEIAVVSVGNGNSHGHPHKCVLERLVAAGTKWIYQTEAGNPDELPSERVQQHQVVADSDIVITTNGDVYSVQWGENNVELFQTDG